MPVPTKRDVKRFCEIDGWEELSRTEHHRYKRTLNNGEILRTRVSFGSGSAFDDPRLWQRVWRVQLGLESEAEFWETLRTGEPPRRGTPLEKAREPGMPAWLFEYLIHRMGRDENDVLEMSEEKRWSSTSKTLAARIRSKRRTSRALP
jgi:hypothetical protein